jgi:hypothetical protein
VTLFDLWHVLARARWALLGFAVVSAILSAGYALSRKPLYESSALLAPVEDPSSQLGSVSGLVGRLGGLSDVLGVGGATGASAEGAVALMESREFTVDFLRRNDILPILYPDRWDAERHTWRTDTGASPSLFASLSRGTTGPGDGAGQIPGEPSAEKAYERFLQMREIVIDRRTGFVRLRLRAPSPAMARTWLDALIRDANARLRDKALAEVRSSLAVLTERMDSLRYASVRSTVTSLLELYMRREVLLLARTDYALSAIDPPNLPEQRVYPRRTRMVAIGSFLGLLLGCAIVLLVNAWRGIGATAAE